LRNLTVCCSEICAFGEGRKIVFSISFSHLHALCATQAEKIAHGFRLPRRFSLFARLLLVYAVIRGRLEEALVTQLNYGRMMQRAMLGVVAEILSGVAEDGLPGDHHFYITFHTHHQGVDMPDWLSQRYPSNMTLVLQHEFYDLAVLKDRFSVKLSFNDKLETLVVPFDSLVQFADPSAEFGIRFDQTDEEEPQHEDDVAALEDQSDAPLHSDEPKSEPEPAFERSGEVVNLDAFRKK
jgi:hypothetical protein